MIDDGLILQQTVLYNPWQYFFHPHAYRLLSHGNLTPWLTLAYDFDYSLFGVHPLPFRIHELATLGVAIALSFYLLRKLQVPVLLAGLAALVFLLSPPVTAIAGTLSTRHYLIGLVFTIISLIAFLNARAGESSRKWLLLSW